MPGPGAGDSGYIASWRPSPVTAQAACFARQVVAASGPHGRDRAKNLLWAAGKLAGYGIGLGLEPVPAVLLHPSVTERFTAHAPGLTAVTRRTLRTNLRFIARRVVPQLVPADAPLPRERGVQRHIEHVGSPEQDRRALAHATTGGAANRPGPPQNTASARSRPSRRHRRRRLFMRPAL